MKKFLLLSLLIIAMVNLSCTSKDKPPVISSLTAIPSREIGKGESVTLLCKANDPNEYKYKLIYTWKASDGNIFGSGPVVTYTAPDTLGKYTITIVVSDDRGKKVSKSIYISVIDIVKFKKTYGGGKEDTAYSIQQTADGGYIVAGSTNSFGAGDHDFYIIKLDKEGTKQWEKIYGGIHKDMAYSIQQTTDGGYIVAGHTYSFDVYGYSNFYIIKLDKDGAKLWEKSYGAYGRIGWDMAFSIQQTADAGYVVAGNTSSNGYDVFIIKLNKIED